MNIRPISCLTTCLTTCLTILLFCVPPSTCFFLFSPLHSSCRAGVHTVCALEFRLKTRDFHIIYSAGLPAAIHLIPILPLPHYFLVVQVHFVPFSYFPSSSSFFSFSKYLMKEDTGLVLMNALSHIVQARVKLTTVCSSIFFYTFFYSLFPFLFCINIYILIYIYILVYFLILT